MNLGLMILVVDLDGEWVSTRSPEACSPIYSTTSIQSFCQLWSFMVSWNMEHGYRVLQSSHRDVNPPGLYDYKSGQST